MFGSLGERLARWEKWAIHDRPCACTYIYVGGKGGEIDAHYGLRPDVATGDRLWLRMEYS